MKFFIVGMTTVVAGFFGLVAGAPGPGLAAMTWGAVVAALATIRDYPV